MDGQSGEVEQVTPVPDQAVGTVFAYRGTEQHGVPMYGEPDLLDEADHGEDVEEREFPPAPEPVDVRIVHTGGREFRRFRTARFRVLPTSGQAIGDQTYAGDVVQVVTRDETRTRVRIQNLSQDIGGFVDRIWVAERRELANKHNGYAIDPGQSLDLSTENEVYAIGDEGASGPINVAVLIEYSVQET